MIEILHTEEKFFQCYDCVKQFSQEQMLFLRYNWDCIYKWCYLKYNEPFFTINKVILNGKNPFQYNNRIMPFLQIIVLFLCLECDCKVEGLNFECDYELNWWDVTSYDTCLIISEYTLDINYFNLTQLCTT